MKRSCRLFCMLVLLATFWLSTTSAYASETPLWEPATPWWGALGPYVYAWLLAAGWIARW